LKLKIPIIEVSFLTNLIDSVNEDNKKKLLISFKNEYFKMLNKISFEELSHDHPTYPKGLSNSTYAISMLKALIPMLSKSGKEKLFFQISRNKDKLVKLRPHKVVTSKKMSGIINTIILESQDNVFNRQGSDYYKKLIKRNICVGDREEITPFGENFRLSLFRLKNGFFEQGKMIESLSKIFDGEEDLVKDGMIGVFFKCEFLFGYLLQNPEINSYVLMKLKDEKSLENLKKQIQGNILSFVSTAIKHSRDNVNKAKVLKLVLAKYPDERNSRAIMSIVSESKPLQKKLFIDWKNENELNKAREYFFMYYIDNSNLENEEYLNKYLKIPGLVNPFCNLSSSLIKKNQKLYEGCLDEITSLFKEYSTSKKDTVKQEIILKIFYYLKKHHKLRKSIPIEIKNLIADILINTKYHVTINRSKNQDGLYDFAEIIASNDGANIDLIKKIMIDFRSIVFDEKYMDGIDVADEGLENFLEEVEERKKILPNDYVESQIVKNYEKVLKTLLILLSSKTAEEILNKDDEYSKKIAELITSGRLKKIPAGITFTPSVENEILEILFDNRDSLKIKYIKELEQNFSWINNLLSNSSSARVIILNLDFIRKSDDYLIRHKHILNLAENVKGRPSLIKDTYEEIKVINDDLANIFLKNTQSQ